MGNTQGGDTGLTLLANQDSEIEPGQKCILSTLAQSFAKGSEDEDEDEAETTARVAIGLEEMFEEMEIFYRFPIVPGSQAEALLKFVELEEHGRNEFTSKVILDGKKLDAAGGGRGDGTDKVLAWLRFVMVSITLPGPSGPRKQTSAIVTHYVVSSAGGAWADELSDDPECISASTVHGLHDRARMEIHFDDRNGERQAGEARVAVLLPFIQAQAESMFMAKRAKVQVVARAGSLKGPGTLCNLSSPLDAFVNDEELFPAMMKVLRQTLGKAKLEHVSEAGFSGEAIRSAARNRRIKAEVTASQEAGEITVLEIAMTEDGSLAWPAWSRVTHYLVHHSPLRVESWEVNGEGERVCTAVSARRLQVLLNVAIDEATSFLQGFNLGSW